MILLPLVVVLPDIVAFASLPLGRDDELRILDVGCGLGFLSCVSAEFYKNARIKGIDTFEHVSLKRSSLEGAKENARILGFSDRIDFKEGDVFRFTPGEKFDIIVSWEDAIQGLLPPFIVDIGRLLCHNG